MLKKMMGLLLVIAFCAAFAVPAYAADNSAVDAKIQELEKRFDIRIQYDTDTDGSACIGTGTLSILEMGLNGITPEVVGQVSRYLQSTLGSKLTYHFSYLYNVDLGIALDDNVEALGAFNMKTGIIKILMPYSAGGTFSSGDNPLTMVHEFGHALHMMVSASYGEAKLEQEWTSLNGGHSYKGSLGDGRYVDTTFISEYASFNFDEDFAETFGHSIIRNRAGLGFSYLLVKDGEKTNLGKKVDYLINLLSQSVQNSGALTANMKQNAYQTPIYTSYQGVSLYGIKLQYIGCAYPRFVLRGILGSIGEEAVDSQWIYEVGGWYVETVSGKAYLLFPGGYGQPLSTRLNLAA